MRRVTRCRSCLGVPSERAPFVLNRGALWSNLLARMEAPSMRPYYRLFIVLTASCERDAGSFDDASDGWDRFLNGYLATVDQLVVS